MNYKLLILVLVGWFIVLPTLAGIRDGLRDAFRDGRKHYGVSNWRLLWWLITGEKRDSDA